MKEEYRGYRPGDRVQMVERNDPYAPILPGEKGAIAHIDDAGTLRMRWDDGRTLGVCLEEDIVRKVPPEQEMELLSSERSCNATRAAGGPLRAGGRLTGAMQSYAEEQGCDWVVKRTFIDEAHSQRPPKYQYIEAVALDDLIEGTCDLKNGTDVGFMAKRPPSEQSIAIIAYGQGYTVPSGVHLVKELLELKLISPAAARDFRERVEAGWDPDGRAAMQLFNSPGDRQPLAPLIRACKESVRSMPQKGKGRGR